MRNNAEYMGCIAYKRCFVNIISIIFITLIPYPGVRIYYQHAQSFLLKIFILFFLFFCFISSQCANIVALSTVLIRLKL